VLSDETNVVKSRFSKKIDLNSIEDEWKKGDAESELFDENEKRKAYKQKLEDERIKNCKFLKEKL